MSINSERVQTSAEIARQGIVNIWNAYRCSGSDNPSKLLLKRIKDRTKATPKGKEAKKISAIKRKKSDAQRVLTMIKKNPQNLKTRMQNLRMSRTI